MASCRNNISSGHFRPAPRAFSLPGNWRCSLSTSQLHPGKVPVPSPLTINPCISFSLAPPNGRPRGAAMGGAGVMNSHWLSHKITVLIYEA